MKRREVIALFGSGAAWSVAARAEQRASPVIGLLSGASLQTMRQWVAAFHSGLAEAGFAEGRNVVIEYRWAEGNLTGSRSGCATTALASLRTWGRRCSTRFSRPSRRAKALGLDCRSATTSS